MIEELKKISCDSSKNSYTRSPPQLIQIESLWLGSSLSHSFFHSIPVLTIHRSSSIRPEHRLLTCILPSILEGDFRFIVVYLIPLSAAFPLGTRLLPFSVQPFFCIFISSACTQPRAFISTFPELFIVSVQLFSTKSSNILKTSCWLIDYRMNSKDIADFLRRSNSICDQVRLFCLYLVPSQTLHF